jgi:O-antigen ligase
MEEAVVHRSRRRRRESRSSSFAQADWLSRVQGGLISILLVLPPWLFGCTERWAIWLMNIGGYVAGICAVAMLARNRNDGTEPEEHDTTATLLARSFFGLNILVLLYCLAAALNARADFSIETQSFTYRSPVINWLPSSYDRARSWQFLANALAMCCAFWSIYLWLRGGRASRARDSLLSPRLKVLLWVFCVNGFLVALQGTLQRLSNRAELLWFRKPYSEDPHASFGSFAYRGNAVDYLNLVWPVTFALWYLLSYRRARKPGISDGPELLLLPMFLVTAAASFATLSRGGAVVAAAMLLALMAAFLSSANSRRMKTIVSFSVALIIALAFILSGNVLATRFRAALTDNLSGRIQIYENARQMAADFPWLGSGPGTFLSIYHLYRADEHQGWAAFLHDDWLETRITFGRIGMAVVLLQLVVLLFWTFRLKPRWVSPALQYSLFLSIAGCLAHAKRDFPFQTYGVFFTFVAVCALLPAAVVSAPRDAAENPSL